MKSNHIPVSHRSGGAFPSQETATVVETDGLTYPPLAHGTVRILLGIDVPACALPAIEADWALVAATQQNAPDLAPGAIASALERLLQQAVQVPGVAVAEQVPNPFVRWTRAASADDAIAA